MMWFVLLMVLSAVGGFALGYMLAAMHWRARTAVVLALASLSWPAFNQEMCRDA